MMGRLQITIDAGRDLDFTPCGKRRARVVQTTQGPRLRWYVGRRLYMRHPPAALTAEWLANEGAPNHRPQPWAILA